MRKLETRTFGGRDITVYLTESQWRGLLRRFDKEEIQRKSGWFYIEIPCMLCRAFVRKRGADCQGCPLMGVGCLHLVAKHGSQALSDGSSSEKIGWSKLDNMKVRKGIRNIRKVLLDMPRARRF